MKVLIFITWPVKAWTIPDEKVALLTARFPNIEFVHVRTIAEAREVMSDVEVAFTPHLTPDMVTASAAPQLKWVHSPAAAVEGLLPLAELAARGIVVTNSRGIQAVPIAEHVIGGVLMLSRKFDRMLDAQRAHRWIQNDLFDDWPWVLNDRRMTIVGLGTIGMEVAKRAHAFGMKITGVRRNTDQPRPRIIERVLGTDQLDEALTGCDVLVLCAPGVASTQGIIGAKQLALLNAGAILVNVARAQIVDGAALLHALESRALGGAVLDVFEKEPLDPASPLWAMPNVVITPHSSGFRSTHFDDVTALFVENFRRYQRLKPLKYVVDLAAGY
jgi:phosphoglycerate dehydrogenase-like enzyme